MSDFSNTCTESYETSAARASGLRSFFSAVMREIRIRRALREVSALDDAILQDIGLGPSHSGIESAIRNGRDC
ncbi:DUF1127 domain-containing protein [Microvirga makkahensis]|uniref:DUF1127 domain-containing protein n=1 Tax=Microvirga makkahensis TaxID=1128670 RepID=A0A7X3MQT9_9HYPH|nr:DUF1127 domain-containing protein [Microvirga makkahensis]MXQ11519.1 DUF1127 domain-containing protein [Microvirga makkahensis]